MRRFFFDTYDDGSIIRDEEGLECADREAVRHQATKTLPHMAFDGLPDGPTHEFCVVVRDDEGRQVFRANLSFSSEWLDT